MKVWQNLFKNRGFTLAEVLITLGIIGVVAALTIPVLINKYQERVTVIRLKQTYSLFSEAFKLATVDNGDIKYWDIGTGNTADGSVKLYNIFKPYFKKVNDCGLGTGCFADSYTTMNNIQFSWQPNTYRLYARGILLNNVSFLMWSNGRGCESLYYRNNSCGSIFVDINGSQKPNQAGKDLFGFYITTKGIIPFSNLRVGDDNCILSQTSNGTNGLGCTSLVLENENLDYLKSVKN